MKYSFDNNLITPGMRVVLGTVVGLALIATGWLTATRRYRVSGQSLCADADRVRLGWEVLQVLESEYRVCGLF